MPGNCPGGSLRLTGASPIRRASTISLWSTCCSRGPTSFCGPFSGPARSRAISGIRFSSRRSTPIPPRLRRRWPGPSCAKPLHGAATPAARVVAVEGLSAAFVDPALDFLRARGAEIRFGAKLRAIQFEGDRAAALDFGEDVVTLAPDDRIVLAVTAPVAARPAAGPRGADGIPRHRQRPFRLPGAERPAAADRESSAARANGCSAFRIGCR